MSGWNKELGLDMDTDECIHVLEYNTSQEAWESINEKMLRLDSDLFERGGTANSGVSVVYNVFVRIKRAWMNPDFDYGRLFNYTLSKWTSLLNNYIDFNKLDLIRSKLRTMTKKYNQNYNVTYLFHNRHDNGKQCLLSATFSRRFQQDNPVITVHMRASEVTKRLAFDLLLIQRMAEYVYGPGQPVQINLFLCQMFGNIETLLMYTTVKRLKKIFKGVDHKNDPWFNKVQEVYDKMKNGTEAQYSKFKVFFRSFIVLRPDLYTYRPLIARDLVIEEDDIEYPEDCISYSQRKKYKKKYLEQQKRNAVKEN